MPLPTLFSNLTNPTLPELDANFAAVAALGAIPCTVSGTNSITMTPNANTPTLTAYANYLQFSGIVAVTSTGAVTINAAGLGALNAYRDTSSGPLQLNSGDLFAGNAFTAVYDSTLNSNAGGFHCYNTQVKSSASYVLLNTLTPSNVASISDTTSLTSAYSWYDITFQNVIPITDEAIFELQVHSGGSFRSTGYLTTLALANAGSMATNSNSTTFIPLSFNTASNASNPLNVAPGISGHIRVYTPSTSGLIMFEGQTAYNAHTGQAIAQTMGYWNTSGVVDGFQLLFSTGNISSGTIKIYGIP